MRVVHGYPPNYKRIVKHFDLRGKHPIFTYGETLYNPWGGYIEPALMAHEETHERQQGDAPDIWWEKYIVSPEFRLEQELEAYRVQHAYAIKHYNRAVRKRQLKSISRDLSRAMYGYLVTRDEAEKLITEGQE